MIPKFNFGKDGDLLVKHSKQRDAILTDLQGRYDHPTAEMVFASIREVLPNISLGTVYRNLSKLAESNMALRRDVGDGNVHFDATDARLTI